MSCCGAATPSRQTTAATLTAPFQLPALSSSCLGGKGCASGDIYNSDLLTNVRGPRSAAITCTQLASGGQCYGTFQTQNVWQASVTPSPMTALFHDRAIRPVCCPAMSSYGAYPTCGLGSMKASCDFGTPCFPPQVCEPRRY